MYVKLLNTVNPLSNKDYKYIENTGIRILSIPAKTNGKEITLNLTGRNAEILQDRQIEGKRLFVTGEFLNEKSFKVKNIAYLTENTNQDEFLINFYLKTIQGRKIT